MSSIELKRAGSLSYREAVPPGGEEGDPVLLVHGFPQSSRMWVGLMEALAAAGRRSVAPDLYCLGDSTDPGPATYERNREALAELVADLGLGPSAWWSTTGAGSSASPGPASIPSSYPRW